MTSRAVRAHEEKYRAAKRDRSLERRIVSTYAGVATQDVAYLESIAPSVIGTIRADAGLSVDDGLPTSHTWPTQPQMSFEQIDRMMRTNRSAG